MRYCNTLIATQDMPRALAFHKKLFDQEVTVDLGWRKTLTCGLTLQEHFDEIAGFPADSMKYHNNTMELYFETEDFDGFVALLDSCPEVARLHEPKMYPWFQRGIHIYDPDGHLIEVSESMYSVACKHFAEGKSLEETAKLTQFPMETVIKWHECYLKRSENQKKVNRKKDMTEGTGK